MKRIIYGKAGWVQSANSEGCQCDSHDSHFYVNDRDYRDDLFRHSIKYTIFDKVPDSLSGVPFDEYYEGYPQFETIKNALTEIQLLIYGGAHTSEEYKGTCYSEWTCGYPSEVTFHHIGELGNIRRDQIILLELQ